MKAMIRRVLEHPLLQEKPPVLLDIGASSRIHPRWRSLAPHSICIAFDPDVRLMDHVPAAAKAFRRYHVMPMIVHDSVDGECDFYLASSPECSSTLKLRSEAVKRWHFQYFFQLAEKTALPCGTLPRILAGLGIDAVDCFKADTQGTDLRILTSLGADKIARLLTVELEPGPSVAYENDDTAGMVLRYMETHPEFRLIDLRPLGSQYFPLDLEEKYLTCWQRRLIPTVHRSSPLWFELTWLNDFSRADEALFGKREYLLGWVLAMEDREFGWALELCQRGETQFDDPLFGELRAATLKSIPWLGPTVKRLARKLFGCDR